MKKLSFLFGLLALISFGTLNAQSNISDQSMVAFEIGNLWLNTVEGTIKGMKGTVDFDPENLKGSKFNVCVDVNTINTGIDKRDAHLKTADFFDVEKYPTICFESKAIHVSSDGYSTTGDLTIHGVTKEVTIPFTYAKNIFTGTIEVNRLDYKVGVDYGSFKAQEEVSVSIVCVLK